MSEIIFLCVLWPLPTGRSLRRILLHYSNREEDESTWWSITTENSNTTTYLRVLNGLLYLSSWIFLLWMNTSALRNYNTNFYWFLLMFICQNHYRTVNCNLRVLYQSLIKTWKCTRSTQTQSYAIDLQYCTVIYVYKTYYLGFKFKSNYNTTF